MLSSEERAGIYVTVIIHLTVIIVLLIAQIGASRDKENSFVLDFTKQEEVERQIREAQQLKEQMERVQAVREALHNSIQQELGERPKNVAVDRGGNMKDDRGTDSKKLYEDARKLEQELKKGYTPDKVNVDEGEIAADSKSQEKGDNDRPQYSGASVLSWQLDGRKAVSLPKPAYKCYGSGTVTVLIVVDKAGKVLEASIQEGASDPCLQSNALRCAKSSRFNASNDPKIPDRQTGNIIYEFIAQ